MKARREAGQALIVAIMALGILLMGFAGLGIDLGYLRYQKRLQQSAADGAAMAAAAELPFGSSGVTNAAKYVAQTNGFADTNGNTGCPTAIGCVTVTVNNPPLSGPHSGVSGYVEVYIAAVQPTFFMRVLGINSESISARAVATPNGIANGCLYTVGPPGTDGILINGNNDIEAPNCGIVVDSNMTIHGNSATVNAGSIGVAGTYTGTGNPAVSPAPVSGVKGTSDPLAYLTSPSTSGSCLANPNVSGNGAPVTINPGNYCNGITIAGSKNVTFNPGVYTITGGGFTDTSGSGTLTGNGVMFYVTSGSINLSGSNAINLSAPTSNNAGTGQVAGLLFWQAASDTNDFTMNGGNSSVITGIFYAPGAQVTLRGHNTLTAYNILVVKAVRLNGNNALNLTADTSGLTGGSPIKNTTLVE